MKNLLLLAFLAGATAVEAAPTASAATRQTGPDQQPSTPPAKEAKAARKARKHHTPEVYKGSVAKQSRIVTDAAGAEKDPDDTGDGTATKGSKKKE